MEFEVGECIVYPTHGVAIVESVGEIAVAGTRCRCYRVRMLASGAVALIPVDNALHVGLRRTIPRRAVNAILDRLRLSPSGAAVNWKDRYQENSSRLRSGRLEEVAEVLRSLASLAARRPLSFREKTMLDRARELVIGELAVARGAEFHEMGAAVDAALATTAAAAAS